MQSVSSEVTSEKAGAVSGGDDHNVANRSSLPLSLAQGFGAQLRRVNTPSISVIDVQPRSSGSPHGLPSEVIHNGSNVNTSAGISHSGSCLPQFNTQSAIVNQLITMNKLLMDQLAGSSLVNMASTSTPVDYVEHFPQALEEEEEEEIDYPAFTIREFSNKGCCRG
jgi:hypothetical protein